MRLRHLGYACINCTIDTTTGRTLRLDNLDEAYVSEIIEANLAALTSILAWNVDHGLKLFRISSSVIPFASHPAFPIDWRARFADQLAAIREFGVAHDLRLSMHPGQYTVLNSNRPDVVDRAVAELDYHARFLEVVTPDGGDIVLHVGGAYGDKPSAVARFVQNFARLSQATRDQLVIENDDTVYTLDQVLDLSRRIERPVVFDIFHHRCNHPGEDWREGLVQKLEAVNLSWPTRPPKLHISTARHLGKTAHADFIDPADATTLLDLMAQVDADRPFDLMVEAKQKDIAALALRAELSA
ncbi:MAG: UV DNA damage repair endonuclease UvsE [Myxococcota bacterium]